MAEFVIFKRLKSCHVGRARQSDQLFWNSATINQSSNGWAEGLYQRSREKMQEGRRRRRRRRRTRTRTRTRTRRTRTRTRRTRKRKKKGKQRGQGSVAFLGS